MTAERSTLTLGAVSKCPYALFVLALVACGQAASESALNVPSSTEAPAGKRPPCTLGADQTCNADPSVSSLWGRCTELGVCECQSGFVVDPLGRCQPQ